MAGTDCVPDGAGSLALGEAAGEARDGVERTGAECGGTNGGRIGGVERVPGAVGAGDGGVAGEISIGAAAGGD